MEKKGTAPAISALLPVHNAEPYLAEALDSLLAQSFQDFEVIAVDDGSADDSGKILDEYATRDPRVRVFHRPQRGLVSTLNEGIDLARGEWIARMDADDIALPNRFEVQLNHLLHSGADFCGGPVECFGDWRAVWRYPESHEACEIQLLFDVPFAHPTVMGRRTAFQALRYDPRYVCAEDYDCWQRAWAAGYRLTNVSDLILRYRVHAKQVSLSHNVEQRKSADGVRIRHWGSICPDLDLDERKRIVSAFSQGNVAAASLITGMLKVLSHIPEAMHERYLEGSLRIFARVAGHDPRAVIYWLKLCKSTSVNVWRTKVRGISVLLFLAVFRASPQSSIFTWLRMTKNKLFSR